MYETFPCFLLSLVLFGLITKTQLTFHDSSHGFISKNARYFNDEFSHIHEEIESFRYLPKDHATANLNIRFEPDLLDFRERPLAIPHSETVTLFNTDKNKTVELTSISGNTPHFHSSFFEDKKIPPNGNTSFKIVYLGRQEGPVESTLFLHTSSGFVKYNVKAFGTFSNYRVRPIVGVKLPVNSTFTPVIYMHNPHSESIQIVEIYSSGGGFHLELPSGQHEGPNDMWEIHPQETKAVIRVRFEAKLAQNHTAYIRIKLHNPDEILIVPLEVEVSPAQNIFHPQGHVNFGIGGSLDPPKEVDLCLFNPLKRAVRVHSVSTLSKSIKTQYYNVRINPGNEEENRCVNVGTLTVDWKNAWNTQDYHGKIVVKFRNGKNRTEIPYFLTALKGGLTYDNMATTYFMNEKEADTTERKFEVLNEFQYPVRVMEVKFPVDIDTTFKIQTFTPKIISPNCVENLFNIRLKSTTKRTDMQLSSYIKLITNVSEISVPLLSYNGKIQLHLPFSSTDDNSLNIGLIGYDTKKDIHIILSNPNPVDLALIHVYSSIPMTELKLLGCGRGDHKKALLLNSFENLTSCEHVIARGYAVVRMSINAVNIEGQVWGDIQVRTPYENLSLPVQFKVSPGQLVIDAEELVFRNCFPTKSCSLPLKVFSSFTEKMKVENIVALPPDKRISATITGAILPKTSRVIGHLHFNPDAECGSKCYTGFLSEGSATWLGTLTIIKQVSEYDLQLVNMYYERYLNFTRHDDLTNTNLSLRLDTSEVKGQNFHAEVKYVWPSLILGNDSRINFPLTQVGNVSHRSLILHNPSNHNVVVQLLFDNDYPHSEMLYDGLPSNFIPPSEAKYVTSRGFFFDEKLLEYHREYFWHNLRVNAFKHSLPILLKPGQSRRVVVSFLSEEAKFYTSLLLLRNNLTILEVVRLNAKGAMPLFKFGNRRPGATSPLLFDMTEKLGGDCSTKESIVSGLTLKRSFTAKNLGEIPVHVYDFLINGYSCEAYGFKVLDCEPFILLPNSSKIVEIAFTADLALSSVSRNLVLVTSLNTLVNYSLYTVVPPSCLSKCESLIERPFWEIYLSYVSIFLMNVTLCILLFMAIYDAEIIKRQAWAAFMASNNPSVQPVLDLRKIGKQVREEIQTSLKEKRPDEEEKEEENEAAKSEPAVIPITGRTKKKLSQRNSCENETAEETRERQRKKDILFERHRLKSRERRTEKELKQLEENKKREKHVQTKEAEPKRAKPAQKKPPNEEEEASSTTTESSSSSAQYEEVNKENQRLKTWPEDAEEAKKSPALVSENKYKHVSFVNSKLRPRVKKPGQLTDSNMLKIGEKLNFGHNNNNNSLNRETKRKDLKYKDRRDKLVYRNKAHNDKKSKVNGDDSVTEAEKEKSPVNFYIPFPEHATVCRAWNENKAKFSDVVAQKESINESRTASDTSPSGSSESPAEEDKYFNYNSIDGSNTRASYRKSGSNQSFKSPEKNQRTFQRPEENGVKPSVYAEQYKPMDLGPIGSKRLGTPGKESPDLLKESSKLLSDAFNFTPINDSSVIAAISNNTIVTGDSSFFSQPTKSVKFETPVEESIYNNSYVNSWNRQQKLKQFLCGREHNLADPEMESGLLSEPRDLWRKEAAQSGSKTARDSWSNTFSSVLDSTAKLESNTSYLWGSNPVWTPWTPADAPASPRKSPPPGFTEKNSTNRLEEEKRMQQRNSYSPFSSGCTWAQQKNPWD